MSVVVVLGGVNTDILPFLPDESGKFLGSLLESLLPCLGHLFLQLFHIVPEVDLPILPAVEAGLAIAKAID